MNTKEAIEFVDNRLCESPQKDQLFNLLKRGEKYEAIVKEIEEAMSPGGIIEYDFNYENYLRNNAPNEIYIKFMRNSIKKIKQKYFPKPIKKTITITQKEIYPWWNISTKDEKMEVYFKYYSSGTYDDCIEWWDRIDIILKIFVHNTWCEKGGSQ